MWSHNWEGVLVGGVEITLLTKLTKHVSTIHIDVSAVKSVTVKWE